LGKKSRHKGFQKPLGNKTVGSFKVEENNLFQIPRRRKSFVTKSDSAKTDTITSERSPGQRNKDEGAFRGQSLRGGASILDKRIDGKKDGNRRYV